MQVCTLTQLLHGVGKNHEPTCSCTPGYFGDPLVGCKKKECDSDSQCSDDKLCNENMCKIACLVENNCGENTICSSEKHRHICYCQPGYTGNPIKGCNFIKYIFIINYCSSNPCGNGAECKNFRDGAQCTCPPGQVGDPYVEECRLAQECQLNKDCPLVARYTVVDGIRKCTGKYIIYLINTLYNNVIVYA